MVSFSSLALKGRSKYGNRRVGTHASKKEHARAATLNLMQRAGLISNLREQVPYELIPAQYEQQDVKNILVLENGSIMRRKEMKVNTLNNNALYENLYFPMLARMTIKKT